GLARRLPARRTADRILQRRRGARPGSRRIRVSRGLAHLLARRSDAKHDRLYAKTRRLKAVERRCARRPPGTKKIALPLFFERQALHDVSPNQKLDGLKPSSLQRLIIILASSKKIRSLGSWQMRSGVFLPAQFRVPRAQPRLPI